MDLAGLAETRTGALPSHNLKPERYVQSACPATASRLTGGRPGRAGLAQWTWRDWKRLGRELCSVSLASGGQQTDRRAARSGLIDPVVLAGLAATRTGAPPSCSLKPERYVQAAWASGGQQTDRQAARSGLIGSVDLAGLAATRTGAAKSQLETRKICSVSLGQRLPAD